MATRITVRRDTAANWAASGEIPQYGEPIAVVDTLGAVSYKIGDGQRTVPNLPALSKGDKGDKGEPGRDGSTAAPTDEAVASYFASDSETRRSADRRYPIRSVVDVRDYGVLEASNDTARLAALQTALTAAAGGTLLFPAGQYQISGSLAPSKTDTTTIRLEAGAKIVQTANVPTINHVGAFSAPIAVTGGATLASEVITVADVTNVSIGSVLLVSSDDAMPNISTVKEGMLRVVRSISGNDVTIDSALYVALPTSPVVRVVSVVPRVNITGEGELLHATPATMKKALLQFTAARAPRISGIALHDSGGPGVQLDHVLGGATENIQLWNLLDDASTGHFGYGVNLGGTTRNFRVGPGSATNVRHGVTTNGGPQTDTAGTTFTAGGPEGNVVSAEFVVSGGINAGLDTHEPGYGNVIDGTVIGCAIGVQDRARSSIIRGKVIGAALYGYNIGEQTRGSYLDHPIALASGARTNGAGIRVASDATIDTPTIRDGGPTAINALAPYALVGDGDVRGTIGGSAGPTRRGSGLLGVVSPSTGTGSYTTTSTTYVEIDPAVFSLTVTVPASGRVTVRASFFMRQVTANAGAVKMTVMDVDGTGISTPIAVTGASMTESSVRIRLEYVARITGLVPGTQKTLRLGWRVIGGTGEITLAGTDTGQGVFEVSAS